ncbi:MAG: MgtC/SapB family protein [Candidatus Omnitrophica bacterium]|nr:MgtC/SapB family protein [Candidatus Omnitrophota bacterium]
MIDVYQIAWRLFIAALFSGTIGFERELHGRAAGLRTTILVGVGSCLIMIISLNMFYTFNSIANLDPTRMAAQVVSGIGFLGAGTILRFGISVRGLTTAAGLWAVSGIGLAVGVGFFSAAFLATAIIFIVLVLLSKLERQIKKETQNTLYIELEDGISRICQIIKDISSFDTEVRNLEIDQIKGSKNFGITLHLQLYSANLKNQLTQALLKTEGVVSVKWY